MEPDKADLIRQAFEKARASGRSDWRLMTVAVLKNRLLDITQRRFHERQFGAETFLDFVRGAGPLVRVDETRSPALVEFVGDLAESAEPRRREAGIRPDLWRAVMDYASNRTFVWDVNEGAAREIREGEAKDFALPTITPEILSEWRGSFCTRIGVGNGAALLGRLETWQKRRLPSTSLPGPLRGEWNHELKTRVDERLRAWFAEKGVPAPDDLLSERSDAGAAGEQPGRRVEALRGLVLACVQEMTERELAALPLPAAAVLRVRDHRG